MCCVFRSPSSCSSASSQSGSSSMWSSHCDRRRGASWEKVWMYWKTCWDNQMNCCHANLMLKARADVAQRTEVTGWTGMTDSPVWFRMCWKSVCPVVMAPEQDRKAALINTITRAGERSKTVHRKCAGQTRLVTICTQVKQNYKETE